MATEAAIGSTASARPGLPGVIVAATIGNVLEWFDFLVYGFFAVTIAEVFFPVGNPTVSLLITFGTFGVAYLVRPLGAIIVGTYTDRAGRKAGLTLSIGLMLIGTALMVITPATRRSDSPRRLSSPSRACCKASRSAASSAARSPSWSSMPASAAATARAGNGPPSA